MSSATEYPARIQFLKPWVSRFGRSDAESVRHEIEAVATDETREELDTLMYMLLDEGGALLFEALRFADVLCSNGQERESRRIRAFVEAVMPALGE